MVLNSFGSTTDPENIRYRAGTGNWSAFTQSEFSVNDILRAAENWKAQLTGVARPWLCWSVDADWSLIQQRLVAQIGWTPVVGFDPRSGPPALISSAILIDFNDDFQFATMWFHFPLEFAFAFCDRLAFWHSDLLCRYATMATLAEMFENLADGEIAAVALKSGMRERLDYRSHRFFELVGCTTRRASKDQFDKGCGWWVNFAQHPNAPDEHERRRRIKYHWESGVGIKYWSRRYGGRVRTIPESFVAEGHFTRINNRSYQTLSPDDYRRDLTKELPHNFRLVDAARKLGIDDLL